MRKLRSLHLYLGCIFAPMLLFFAMTGIWQTFGLHSHSHFLARLSTIHTSHGLKTNDGFANIFTMMFVLLMTVSFIISVILGVVMALRFGGSKRAALYCLAAGIVVPLALMMISVAAR